MPNTVICTNRLCGKEYPNYFTKCPHCGTSNPQKDGLKKIIAQMTEENNRLLKEGGYVKGGKTNIRKDIPIFIYVIGILALVGLSIVLIFRGFPNHQNNEWLNWGLVVSVSGLVLFISFVLYAFLMSKSFKVSPANNDPFPELSTWNTIGTTIHGSFREVGGTHVSYVFLSLFFPLIPIGCYRVKEGPSISPHRDGAAWKSSTSYSVYGSEKWNFWEVLHVYLCSWSIDVLVLCVIWLLLILID